MRLRSLLAVLFCLLGGLYVVSGLYSVGPQQRGVLLRFGAVADSRVPPGIHYHWPWPIESVERLDVTSIRTSEVHFKSPKGAAERAFQGEVLTGDENMVDAFIKVNYTVEDEAHYLFQATNVESILEGLCEAAMVQAASRRAVDDMLTDGKGALQQAIRDELQKSCHDLELGIQISAVQLQKVDPPFDVVLAFQDVASAREDRHKMIQSASGEHDSRLPEARAEADKMRREAQTDARVWKSRAEGEARGFRDAHEAYSIAPDIAAERLLLEGLESALAIPKKVIRSPESTSHRSDFH